MNDRQLLIYARSIHGKPRKLRVTERVIPLNPRCHIGNRHRGDIARVIVSAEPDRRG